MGNIKLLDCTLRDGGYVNDWKFGESAICGILDRMFRTNVDIVEAGFIRDVPRDDNKAVFPDVRLVDGIIRKNQLKKDHAELAVMAEIAHPIPLDNIVNASETDVNIIRVIVWKSRHLADGKVVDALYESYDYCRGIVEKGYKLCVQPNRTDQYTDAEFAEMIKLFADLDPYAIYVVDSWGTMYSDDVLHYIELADSILPAAISIGFHGHNNMMQAFSTAEKIIEKDLDRDIILDASIAGIGRGAGNLNLELIARYLNTKCGTEYDLQLMYEIYDLYIKDLKKQFVWGATLPFMLSAYRKANPNYAAFFADKLTLREMDSAYDSMQDNDRVLYTDKLAQKYAGKNKR